MEDSEIKMNLLLEKGVGYKPAKENVREEVGLIPIDAMFSPVKRVAYHAGKSTHRGFYDYDKLTLEVETDGTLAPKSAVSKAAYILEDYLSFFTRFVSTTGKKSKRK